jgi:hypothetical protein
LDHGRGLNHNVIVALHAGISTEEEKRIRKDLEAYGQSVKIVRMNDTLKIGNVFSYEKLMEYAKISEGKTEMTAVVQILKQMDKNVFYNTHLRTFSRVPTEFQADERLKDIWTIFSNMGLGWGAFGPEQLDDIMRAAKLAKQMA